MKLTNPLDKRRKAGIQRRNTGIAKKIEATRTADEPKSTMLRTSPPRIKRLLRKRSPAQKRITWN